MAIRKGTKKINIDEQKNSAITSDILMGELISRYPQVSALLMERGFHCIGCAVSPYESLESGAAVHGLELKPLLKDINALLRKP
ncbi:MAG: DUF1858 domain-containing protein [Patescibacteria group bacterium]